MAQEIKTEIIINASREEVWNVLTNFSQYSEWNPFIKSIEGNSEVGSQIKVVIHPPGGNRMTFKPIVLVNKLAGEFTWRGRFLFKGLMDGEHRFLLKDNLDGSTTLLHSETFKGILVPLLGSTLKNTQKGFEAMNEALKSIVENRLFRKK